MNPQPDRCDAYSFDFFVQFLMVEQRKAQRVVQIKNVSEKLVTLSYSGKWGGGGLEYE